MTQTIILAAGMGSRLEHLTQSLPKPLLQIGEATLLDYSLSFGRTLGAEKQIVVGGYKFDALRSHQERYTGQPYHLVYNPDYKMGSILSLRCCLKHIESDFYLMNADHLFVGPAASRLAELAPTQVSVFCDVNRFLYSDDMKILADQTSRMTLEKISKTLATYHFGYIGMTFVPEVSISAYKAAVEEVIEKHGATSSVEMVVQYFAEKISSVQCLVFDSLEWYEIDTPSDYSRAHRAVSKMSLE